MMHIDIVVDLRPVILVYLLIAYDLTHCLDSFEDTRATCML